MTTNCVEVPEKIPATQMTPGERLYAALEEHVDPATFHGDDPCRCLFGQLRTALGLWSSLAIMGQFGLDYWTWHRIFHAASAYGTDYEGAMAMARRELGVLR
jgi:hypothetical protein